jgi:hypothetical protein
MGVSAPVLAAASAAGERVGSAELPTADVEVARSPARPGIALESTPAAAAAVDSWEGKAEQPTAAGPLTRPASRPGSMMIEVGEVAAAADSATSATSSVTAPASAPGVVAAATSEVCLAAEAAAAAAAAAAARVIDCALFLEVALRAYPSILVVTGFLCTVASMDLVEPLLSAPAPRFRLSFPRDIAVD